MKTEVFNSPKFRTIEVKHLEDVPDGFIGIVLLKHFEYKYFYFIDRAISNEKDFLVAVKKHARTFVKKVSDYKEIPSEFTGTIQYPNGDMTVYYLGVRHSESGPAIKNKGYSAFYLNGIPVSKEVWLHEVGF